MESLIVRLSMQAGQYVSEAKRAAAATSDVGDAADKAGGPRGFGGLAGGLAKAAAGFAAMAAAAKAGQFLGSSITSASNLAESINAVNVQFGQGAATIRAFGEQAATTVGLANSEFNQLSVTTGALLSNFITDQQAAADETVRLTTRAADMASVFNTSVPDALMATQAAIRGETEPIRRYGVMLDDAAIRARAVELGLAGTTAEVDRQAKGLAALDIIYEQTNQTAGDFANTSDGVANRQRILAARFEDTKAAVGESLMPAWEAFLGLAEQLLPHLEDLGPALGNLATGIAGITEVLGPAVGLLVDFIDLVGRGSSYIAEAFGSDTAANANRYREAQDHINSSIARGQDQAAAYADALRHLAKYGDVTTDQVNALGRGIEFVGAQQAVAIGETLKYERSWQATDDMVRGLEQAFVDQVAQLGITRNELAGLTEEYQLSEWAQQQLLQTVLAQETAQRALAEAASAESRELLAEKRALVAAREAHENLNRSVYDGVSAYAQHMDAVRANARAQAEAANPLLRLLRAQDEVKAAQAEAAEAVAKYGSDSQEARDANLGLLEAQLTLETAAADASAVLGDGAEAMLTTAENAGIAEDAVRDLLESLDDLPTTVPINVQVATTHAFGSSGAAGALPVPRAHGGDHEAGQPILVGERGPEVLVPDRAGSVLATGSGMGSRTVYVTINNPSTNGDVATEVQQGLIAAGVSDEVELLGSSTL